MQKKWFRMFLQKSVELRVGVLEWVQEFSSSMVLSEYRCNDLLVSTVSPWLSLMNLTSWSWSVMPCNIFQLVKREPSTSLEFRAR